MFLKSDYQFRIKNILLCKTKDGVTARKCECCGHHEIGITTESGDYIQLKPGMVIEILEGHKHNLSGD